jgi:hypothetical protein
MPLLPNEASQSLTVLSPSFATVRQVFPKLGISKHRLRQVESICLVREQRANGRQELAFNARPFVLCGLPLRRPPSAELVHRRRNGKFFLHVVAHPDYGLPTVRADCTCAPLAFGMGRNLSSLPPAARSAI